MIFPPVAGAFRHPGWASLAGVAAVAQPVGGVGGAKAVLADWQDDYHQVRPPSSLNNQTPIESARRWGGSPERNWGATHRRHCASGQFRQNTARALLMKGGKRGSGHRLSAPYQTSGHPHIACGAMELTSSGQARRRHPIGQPSVS